MHGELSHKHSKRATAAEGCALLRELIMTAGVAHTSMWVVGQEERHVWKQNEAPHGRYCTLAPLISRFSTRQQLSLLRHHSFIAQVHMQVQARREERCKRGVARTAQSTATPLPCTHTVTLLLATLPSSLPQHTRQNTKTP